MDPEAERAELRPLHVIVAALLTGLYAGYSVLYSYRTCSIDTVNLLRGSDILGMRS